MLPCRRRWNDYHTQELNQNVWTRCQSSTGIPWVPWSVFSLYVGNLGDVGYIQTVSHSCDVVHVIDEQQLNTCTVCPEKKETKMFLVISQTKLGQFSWNLVHGFLNKFAIKWCKRFPPNLNNVSTLPCKTLNVHCVRATIELIQKETPEFIPPQLWPPNSPDLNPVDYRVREISQEKM